ncbi:MAG: ATP-binding protein [Planctomycetota bacterium]|nr:ATP-binding protein [Planctomycetota bacterium]
MTLDFDTLIGIYKATPGLVADKLKAVLEIVWSCLHRDGVRGIVFAYDEAQNLADHAERNEFPLSLLLDVFQSLQKKEIPFMLVLVGLPTLFPKLVEARTFSERMFRVIFLDRLLEKDSRDAITKPIEQHADCPVKISPSSVGVIIRESGGYPYFIQFICREVYDLFLQKYEAGVKAPTVPVQDIIRKLDSDFFAGRWARVTDRQRELLFVIARLDNADGEFTVQEISQKSKAKGTAEKPFSASHISQMLATLTTAGLIYKNRHGRYSFAVPLLNRFITRQESEEV